MLLEFFKLHNIFAKEPLPVEDNAVLGALYCSVHKNDYSGMEFVGDLTSQVNRYLHESGERLRLPPRRVGAILARFGFAQRRRNHKGWGVLLEKEDLEKLHRIAGRYGVDQLPDGTAGFNKCPMC